MLIGEKRSPHKRISFSYVEERGGGGREIECSENLKSKSSLLDNRTNNLKKWKALWCWIYSAHSHLTGCFNFDSCTNKELDLV